MNSILQPEEERCRGGTSGVKSVAFMYLNKNMHYMTQNLPTIQVKKPVMVSSEGSDTYLAKSTHAAKYYPVSCRTVSRTINSTYHEDPSRTSANITYTILPHGCCDVVTIPGRLCRRGHVRLRRGYLGSFLGDQAASVHVKVGARHVKAGTWSTFMHRNAFEEHAEDDYILHYDAAPTKDDTHVFICPIGGSSWTRSSYLIYTNGLNSTA